MWWLMFPFKSMNSARLLFVFAMTAEIVAFPIRLTSAEPSSLESLQRDIHELVNMIKPSVVTVSAKIDYSIEGTDRDSPLLGSKKDKVNSIIVMTNIGSGIVFDSTHVMTSALIVQGSKSITIILEDGSEHVGTQVGIDTLTGVAVIKVDDKKLDPVAISGVDQLNSGCLVLIIGNSLGISPSVTLGMVNCIRSDGMIQLSANIAAGNAGGAVFNVKGGFGGILTALISPVAGEFQSGSTFIGDEGALAYPAHTISQRVENIIKHRITTEGWIGVSAGDWPGRRGWIHINSVKSGSPAQAAGLRMGDIILGVNEKKFSNAFELANFVKTQPPGETIKVEVLRGYQTHSLLVGIGEQPKQDQSGYAFQLPGNATALSPTSFGAVRLETKGRGAGSSQLNDEFLLMRMRSIEQELSVLRAMLLK